MLEKVISGGQTGVDQAALRAAKRYGVPTGGWMPKGWLTEAGPRPEFADLYGLREHHEADYQSRTRQNVLEADGTLLLHEDFPLPRGGTLLTLGFARMAGRPWKQVYLPLGTALPYVQSWLDGLPDVRVLNVAGPRESRCPGIGARAEAFLRHLFSLLGFSPRAAGKGGEG